MLLQNKLCAKVYSVIHWSVVMKISVNTSCKHVNKPCKVCLNWNALKLIICACKGDCTRCKCAKAFWPVHHYATVNVISNLQTQDHPSDRGLRPSCVTHPCMLLPAGSRTRRSPASPWIRLGNTHVRLFFFPSFHCACSVDGCHDTERLFDWL